MQTKDFLKQALHQLNVLIKLKLLDQLVAAFDRIESVLKRDYLSKLPYQDQNRDFLDMLDNYLRTQIYQIMSEPDKLKEINNFARLLALKCHHLVL